MAPRASAPGTGGPEEDDPSTLLKGAPAGTLQMSAVARQPTAPLHPSFPSQPGGAAHPSYPGGHASYPSRPSEPRVEVGFAPPGGAPEGPAPHWQQQPAEGPQQPARSRGLLPIFLGVAFGLALVLVVAVIVILTRDPAAPPAASATSPPATESALPSASPSASTPEIPPSTSASSALSLSPSDQQAVAALEKLRSSISACVKERIHGLPGTSPAVPESLAWLKSGPYAPLRRDFSSPFFSCTEFKLEAPMPFMLQWQVDKPGAEGTGVAWIDDDRDGKAERAYGFSGKLKSKDEIELGPVGPIDPSRKVQRGR